MICLGLSALITTPSLIGACSYKKNNKKTKKTLQCSINQIVIILHSICYNHLWSGQFKISSYASAKGLYFKLCKREEKNCCQSFLKSLSYCYSIYVLSIIHLTRCFLHFIIFISNFIINFAVDSWITRLPEVLWEPGSSMYNSSMTLYSSTTLDLLSGYVCIEQFLVLPCWKVTAHSYSSFSNSL